MNGSSTILNSVRCHFMTLGTPNNLPNFKCKNITTKSSASEKLLRVIIDNKLDFTEHLNTVCKKANLKLHTLNRIPWFLSPEQHVLIINAYIKSVFNYCSVTGGLCIKWIRFTSGPYFYYWKTARMIFKISWGPLIIYQSIKDV